MNPSFTFQSHYDNYVEVKFEQINPTKKIHHNNKFKINQMFFFQFNLK